MTSYFARISDGVVAEIIEAENKDDLGAQFHPDLVKDMVEATSEVRQGWDYANGNFDPPSVEPPTLDDIKAERIAILRAACESAIVDGFTSAALGSPHTYPSDIKAQINLMGSVTDSLIPDLPEDWSTPFWVSDTQANWKWEAHTAAQIQQAGRDGKGSVVAAQTKLGELTASVKAAKTKKAVEAITW